MVLVMFRDICPTYPENSNVQCEYTDKQEQHGLITIIRAYVSSSYVREGSPILSLSWWGWGSCYESVLLGAQFKCLTCLMFDDVTERLRQHKRRSEGDYEHAATHRQVDRQRTSQARSAEGD